MQEAIESHVKVILIGIPKEMSIFSSFVRQIVDSSAAKKLW